MFRRLWSGLPPELKFPHDMEELGYFVNEQDEIRWIEDPDYYFNFFLTKNTHVNDSQRFAFNTAVGKIIHQRFEALGLDKIILPLGTTDLSQPHVPIFASRDIGTKSRVVVIFGEPCQDLGVLAYRVVNGPGGVDKGSLVSMVRRLQEQRSSAEDPSPPGIVLANMSENYWWPEGRRAVSPANLLGLPRPSGAHYGYVVDPDVNMVPGNETPLRHVGHLFEKVLPALLREDARVDVIAVSEGSHHVEEYLDGGDNFGRWADRIGVMAIIGGCYNKLYLVSDPFREFLATRARAYVWSERPAGTLISGPQGNPKCATFTDLGCPVIASGEGSTDELILINAPDLILGWVQEAALSANYANPTDIVFPLPSSLPDQETEIDSGEATWNWKEIPAEALPSVSFLDQEEVKKQLAEREAWSQYAKTGKFPAPEAELDV